MVQFDDLPSLEAMREKIDRKQKDARRKAVGQVKENEVSGTSLAMRFGIDVVAGVIVGAGAGYFIDAKAGTKPLFFILLLFLGLAGGLLNVFRSNARYVQALEEQEKNK